MNAIYNEYMTDIEREAEVIITSANANMKKIDLLFEAVDATLEANMLAAEAKVLAENGTYDDLIMLYTEANNEAVKNKEGILQTLINAISTLFTNIGNFIRSIFGKNVEQALANAPDSIELDPETEKEMNFIQKAWNFIAEPFEKIANQEQLNLSVDELKASWKKAVGEVAVATVTAGAATAAAIPVSRNKIIEVCKLIINKIQPFVGKLIAKLKATKFGAQVVAVFTKKNEPAAEQKPAEGAEAPKADEQKPTEGQTDAGSDTEQKKKNWFMEAIDWMLRKLDELGKTMSKWLKSIAGKLKLSKKALVRQNTEQTTQTDDKKTGTEETPAENAEEAPKTESAHLFDMDLDTDMFTESEMSDEEYSDLCDLFAEL